eukprot:4536685-Pyramimonas_sp.AAC.1
MVYILTTNQSDAGSVGMFSRRTNRVWRLSEWAQSGVAGDHLADSGASAPSSDLDSAREAARRRGTRGGVDPAQVDLGLSLDSIDGQFTNVLDELQAELGQTRH